MFNNPAATPRSNLADFTAKLPRSKNRSFYEPERICQSQKPIGSLPEGQQEKNDFCFFFFSL
jgi:hypothetical protein